MSELNYDKLKKELVQYYQDLLIVQYHDKPKAKAFIKAQIEEKLANLLELKVRDAFDIDTAVGVQLDVIGKWVGVDRLFNGQKYDDRKLFSFPSWNDTPDPEVQTGFSTYDTFENIGEGTLIYDYIIATKNRLGDEDFRTLIKLKIVRNNVAHSPKPIDDALYNLFKEELYALWTKFDRSKFTVVGSPTITDDGIASGFSDGYINIGNKIDYNLFLNSSWEVNVGFVHQEGGTHNYLFEMYNSLPQNSVRINNNQVWCSISSSDYTEKTLPTILNAGDKYFIKLEHDNITNKYKLSLFDSNYNLLSSDDTFLTGDFQVSQYDLTNFPIGSGVAGNGARFKGQIDLKQFSITVDGAEVFSGLSNTPMEMTYYYNRNKRAIIELGKEKQCLPIPTGVKANFVEVE